VTRPPLKPLPPPEPVQVDIENKDDALAPFYAALASKSSVVRILHFGDSHVAADIWTKHLRVAFQNRFGDAGSGSVLPGAVFRGYRRVGVSVRAPAKNWLGLTLRRPPEDGLLGLSGAALRGDRQASAATATGRFSSFELEVAAPPGETPCANVSLQDESAQDENVTLEREQGEARPYGSMLLVRNRDPLPLARHTLKVSACGDGTSPILLGLDLRTGQPGVIYDSFGINGVQFADLDKIASPLRQDLLARLNPSLIIVSYGTNDMGGKGFTREAYQAECVRLLRALRAESGGVPVLVTGPIDRPGRTVQSRDHFHERSDMAIAALRAAAQETGCAFWDARAAMGGFGAMLRWRKSGLAQTDMVHLTEPGYQMLAKMLAGELLPPESKSEIP
jgi:lysophospholipase L1-like esterase